MADALISLVVEELGAMAKDELNLLIGVEKEVKKLSSMFTAIQAVLEDAEKQQVKNKNVRDWLGKLKEVAYEVEDILDEWRTDALIRSLTSLGDDNGDTSSGKKVRPFFLFPCLCFKEVQLRHHTGNRIREIIERLNEISMEQNAFRFNPVSTMGVNLTAQKRESRLLINELEVFGREDYKERIIDELVSETGHEKKAISIVSIVGMGGIGKTTLAQLVCNDEKVKTHFGQKIIWVCVSDPFDVNKIGAKIIKTLDGSTSDNQDLDSMQRSLREVVSKTRFLLVLDDVWNESATQWENLRLPLEGAVRGSKVVVTTRNQNVAKVMETTHIHDLGVLSDSESQELFELRALKGTTQEGCQALIEVGKKIVKRCKGIPLAIKAVGSFLRGKNITYWENVLRSEIWEWRMPKDDDILPALLLSYYSMPLHLKQCFSFCSVFPKDHEIRKDELVQLWMAHGIIHSKEAHIEEFGEICFDDLLMLSFFQNARTDVNEHVISCKMHDLVHDLATFVTTHDYCSMEIGNLVSSSVGCHHLTLLEIYDVSSIPSPLYKIKRLRTLIFLGKSKIKEVSDRLFDHLIFLRALDLEGTSIEVLPNSIVKLKHLRYLNLSRLLMKELPETVTNLVNLQTLKLNDCQSLCLLPGGMHKMIKLRHLEIEGTDDLEFLPNGLGKLSSLRTLPKFPVGDEVKGCKIGELKNLSLLRGTLVIENLERVMNENEAREANLDEKCHLQSLFLRCGYKGKDDVEMKRMEGVFEGLVPPHSSLKVLEIYNYIGSKFPNWLKDSKYSSLVEVKLIDCRKCRLFPCLGKLPSLKRLKIVALNEVTVVGGEFYGNGNDRVKGVAFPKLEEFQFSFMVNLEDWKWSEKSGDVLMPSLKKLHISYCQMLKALPDRLPSTLESVKVERCDQVVWMQCNPLPLLQDLILPSNALGTLFKSLLACGLPPPPLKTLEIEGASDESLVSDGWEKLDSLHTLHFHGCTALSSLPEGLGNLKALRALHFTHSRQLTCLSDGLEQLKNLQILQIKYCDKLTSLFDGVMKPLEALQVLRIQQCRGLTCLGDGLGQHKALQTLNICDCPQMTSLPQGLGLLDALQTMTISGCTGLTSLPNCLGRLTSLRRLRFSDCPNLKALPSLQHLAMLERLSIMECPLLTKWFENMKGEDWCNLSHIPSITIDREKYSHDCPV